MAVFIVRPENSEESAVTPLFLETTDRHLNLRARSDLREVVLAKSRIVNQEPTHFHERFHLQGPHGVRAEVMQTSGSGGPFQDHFDIVFAWSSEVLSGDSFLLGHGKQQIAFTVLGDDQR